MTQLAAIVMPSILRMNTHSHNNQCEAFDKASASCRQAIRSSMTPPKNINEYVVSAEDNTYM
jgi:hypothetical protein